MFSALAQMMHFATITLFLLLMRNDQLQTATKTTKQLSELKKHMQQLSDLLTSIDSAIGGSQWFVFFLLGTGNIAGVAFALHLGGGTGSTFLGAGNGGNWYDHQICGGNPLAQIPRKSTGWLHSRWPYVLYEKTPVV